MNIINYKPIIGQKIRQLRLSNNMTQEEFCNAIELEVSNLSNIENGKALPSLQTIIKILIIFQISPNNFFSFVNFEDETRSLLDTEISERVNLLPDNLKCSLLDILKNIK